MSWTNTNTVTTVNKLIYIFKTNKIRKTVAYNVGPSQRTDAEGLDSSESSVIQTSA